MAYNKHTWEYGETITASKLNNMEDGIANADTKVGDLTTDVSDLKNALNSIGTSEENAITFNLTAGRVINSDGSITEAQTSFAITNKIDVTNLESVIITTEMGYGNMLYAFYDSTDDFISGEQSTSSGYTTITNKRISVPANATYLYVGVKSTSYAASIVGVSDFTLNIDSRVEDIEKTMSAYPATEVLDAIPFTEETGEYISNTGALVQQGNSYYTTGYVDISEYSEIYITGSGNYAGVIYAFYDTNKEVVLLGTAIASGSAYTTITDKKTPVPEGAKYVIVAGRFASLHPNIKYLLGYKQIGKWNGKKWVCVGDSLTEENAAASKHYFNYIADDSGVSIVNMGVGGTGYKRGEGENKAFYQRISNVPVDADFVTIFGSGNDLNTTLNYDIGTATDTGTNTLCGCINTTLDNFYTICPATPIGIIAPTPWLGWPTTTPNNRMEQYVEAMKQVCEYRGVPFLDLYHESNLRPENATNRELCFYSQSLDGNADGVHPNNLGHKIIAPKIYEFVKKLLLA